MTCNTPIAESEGSRVTAIGVDLLLIVHLQIKYYPHVLLRIERTQALQDIGPNLYAL